MEYGSDSVPLGGDICGERTESCTTSIVENLRNRFVAVISIWEARNALLTARFPFAGWKIVYVYIFTELEVRTRL